LIFIPIHPAIPSGEAVAPVQSYRYAAKYCMKLFCPSHRLRLAPIAFVALVGFIVSAPVAFADPARLIIHRAPHFGNRQWLRIWIDGNEFEAIAVGHDFNATISPGRHVISVLQTDNPWHFSPTTRVLQVHSGQTCEFTAVWRTDRVVLEERW
jgi:hypothetical protein